MFSGFFKGLLLVCIALFSINAASSAEPDIVKKEGKSSFRIHVSETSFNFNISASLLESFEVFTIPNPSRLVVDASGLDFKKSITVPIKGCSLTSLLRVGIHPDKVRFVFDLTAGQEVDFKANSEVSSGNVVVTSKGSVVATKPTELPTSIPSLIPTLTSIPPTISPTLEPTVEPKITIEPTITSEPTATTPEETPTEVPPTPEPELTEITPTEIPSVETSPLPKGQVLKGITFERETNGKVPFIRISLTNEPKFKLTRSNPKLYKLTIPDASPSGSHLFLPSFPPQDFIGLVSVQTSAESDGAVVFIGVERNEKINAYREGTDILVKILSH